MDTFISIVVAGILSNVLSALFISTVAINWLLFIRLVKFCMGERKDEPPHRTVSSDVAREAMASIEGERPCSDPGIKSGIMGSVREQEKHVVNGDMPSTSIVASIDPTQESYTPSTHLAELAHFTIDCDTLDLGKRSEVYGNNGIVGIVDEELGLS